MPIIRDPLDPKISLWHFLAYQLRFEREKQGQSLNQWGKIIHAARSTVSNIEAGRLKIDDDQAETIDRKYNTGGLFKLLLWFARTSHDPDWLRSYTQYEAMARIIRIYQGQVIPGPFQTEDYARALLEAGGDTDIASTLAERMARQEAILMRTDAPRVWLLLDEGVLDRPVGGKAIMKPQLERLLEVGARPNVIVRIVPKSAGAHIGLDGAFRVISLESRDIAYAGALRGGRLIEATSEVRACGVDFDLIGAKALSEDASRRLIERAKEAMDDSALA